MHGKYTALSNLFAVAMELSPVFQISDSSISSSICPEGLSPVLSEIHTIPESTQIASGTSRTFLAGFLLLSDQRTSLTITRFFRR